MERNTLKIILQETTWPELTTIKNKYPNFINYVVLRYGTYRSRYPDENFKHLFTAIILNNQTELAMGETIVANTMGKLEDNKLGDKVISNTENISKRNNENVSSYSGYNVEGDFAKNANTGNSNHTANITSTNINYFEYLTQMNNSRYKDTWRHINRAIMDLCVTIINIEEI